MTDTNTPLTIDLDTWNQIADISARHGHEMLAEVRRAFGDDAAPSVHTIAVAMMLASILIAIPNPDDVPGEVAEVWSRVGVRFRLVPLQ
ncbi:MAG TPA: hypothetical protein VHT74_25570 [Acetobacteraceae bacterium]|jgi:hypothetical protein|nr:hypothetical protein [Acetobacteraceae bacterium]